MKAASTIRRGTACRTGQPRLRINVARAIIVVRILCTYTVTVVNDPFLNGAAFDMDLVGDRLLETYRPDKRARQIGERDSWICGICQLPIDPEYWRSRLGPQFQALRANLKPEVEHVISRDWGGSEDHENLQIAHAACNRHKHTDPQLPVEDARRHLEWKLGLVDRGPYVPPSWRAPGGSQRVALELAVERGEAQPMYFFAATLWRHEPQRSEQLFRHAAELG